MCAGARAGGEVEGEGGDRVGRAADGFEGGGSCEAASVQGEGESAFTRGPDGGAAA